MKTILLIEDNNNILENLTEYFELEGYKIITAKNGAEGILFANECKPDLIVCDINMPEVDGFEVIKNLVVENEIKIPFIFSSSHNKKCDIEKAKELGATDYIIKPYNPEVLLNMMRKYL